MQTFAPLTVLHTVHSPEATASNSSSFESMMSISRLIRGLNPACHAGCSGSVR